MHVNEIKSMVPKELYEALSTDVKILRPCQEKAVRSGLLEGRSILVCTPTASGKTLVAELAAMKLIMERRGKAVYIAPLKALVSEKYKEISSKYKKISFGLSIGDMDKEDLYLRDRDFIFCTSEKLDSLIRHRAGWLKDIRCLIIDEIHLLDDPARGPTLEILITLMRQILRDVQIIALSATIGNAEELAVWLDAALVVDDWRPVQLKRGIILGSDVEFYE